MSVPLVQRAYLLNTTIVPSTEDKLTFNQFLTRLYEDIALAVNQRDFIYFPMAISGVPTTIPNLPLFGTFIILISGQLPGLPCISVAITKSDIFQNGFISEISEQDGNVALLPDGTPNPWLGLALMVENNPVPAVTGEITIQIKHSGAVTLQGNFNIRIIGTQ